jgi:hypothetical protein
VRDVRGPILSTLLFALDCAPATPREAPRAPPETPGAPAMTSVPARIVVIGDLLGEAARSDRALSRAGLVSPDGHWAGGATVVVQLGDLIDPGPDTKVLLERWMALSEEARAAGGRVIVLLGEHEALDLLGEWKQAAREDIAAFGDGAGRVEALSARQPMGRWLRSLDAAVAIGGTVFVHGGISEQWAKADLALLSSQTRAAIGKTGPAFVLGAEGPLRYRGFVRPDAVDACGEIARTLAELGMERIVVGHGSPPSGSPEWRCEGRLIWVGSSEAPAVVEFTPAGVHEIGGDGPVEMQVHP